MSKLLQSLPDSWVIALQPGMESVIKFNQVSTTLPTGESITSSINASQEMKSQIAGILESRKRQEKSGGTLFSALLDSDLPPEELTPLRLHHESISIIGAGVESTMRTLVVACFHILDQPAIEQRLRAELEEAIPDPSNFPIWDKLGKLPYLTACIEEALRLSYGTSQRMPRAYPNGTLQYKEWTIPPNTMVSMDNYAVSHDEKIFPNSFSFIPDRWLGDPRAPDGKQLSRCMVSFGKGTRSCTGMQLGYAELYIGLANFFRRIPSSMRRTSATWSWREIASPLGPIKGARA